jgi:hypothetical protein
MLDFTEIREWQRRHWKVISILGLSASIAYMHKDKVEDLSSDLNAFTRRLRNLLTLALLILVFLVTAHVHWIADTVKLRYLVAYYSGLIGSGIASYGFLLHLRGLGPRKPPEQLFSFPPIPRRPEDFSHYAERLSGSLSGYFEAQNESGWDRAKMEIRRQLSFLVGFLLIVLRFLIQLWLQFAR